MFIKKDAKLIIDLCKEALPEEIVDDDAIIIAGGFALNAFMVNEVIISTSLRSIQKILLSSFVQNPIIPYSDVDIWSLESSKNSGLFSKLEAGNIIKCNDGKSLSLQRTSDWANTFNLNNPKKKTKSIQCIIKPQKSAEELISSFDLGIASIAIHKGQFIIHPNFFKSLESEELIMNDSSIYKKKSLPSRIFQALRHFKYYKKTNFSFSKELYGEVLSTFADANQFWIEAQKEGSISQWGGIVYPRNTTSIGQMPAGRNQSAGTVKIVTSNNYEQEVQVKESVVGMIRSLASSLSDLQEMKSWNIAHILFLQDSPIFPVKSILEKELNKRSDSRKEF